MGGSGISWAICKSAPCCRQITTPAPHHSVFTGQMPFLPPNQQRQSTEGTILIQVTCAKILVKIGRVVLEICSRTDKETGKQTRSSQYSAAVQAGGGVTNLAVDAAVGRLLACRADEHRRSRARLTPHVGHLVVGRRLGRLVRAGARVGVGDSRTTWPMSRTRRKPRMM